MMNIQYISVNALFKNKTKQRSHTHAHINKNTKMDEKLNTSLFFGILIARKMVTKFPLIA